MKRIYLYVFTAIICINVHAQNNYSSSSWSVVSPDGKKSISLQLKNGQLFYTVKNGRQQIIQPSHLGIVCNNGSFENDLKYVDKKDSKIDETYIMTTGKRRINKNSANAALVSFKNSSNQPMQIEMRAYNDGVAWRYNFTGIKTATAVLKESTTFAIDPQAYAWMMPYGRASDWAPAYEEEYTKGAAAGSMALDSTGWAFPALFKTNDNFLLITEAQLDSNYFGAHLQHAGNAVFNIAMPQHAEALHLYPVTATAANAFSTPWRTFIYGNSLGTIIESNLVHHLAAPNKIGDVSWIKPGRSSWSWWGDHASSKNFESLKKFVDLSKIMGWEYSLVDANWDIMEGGTIEDLVHYANEQKILLTLWYNSGGPHNKVTERPRDIMNDPVNRKAEFKKLNRWGIKAVKIDFFNSDKQEIIKLYLDILKDAAAAKIMVVFHGCTLPRGWSRTYPNLISMEAIKGAEQYGWDTAFAKNSAQHNITAMCIRNVVGPMDYTPVTFSSYDCCKHSTSNAYELATAVLFESGMLHFADKADAYLNVDKEIKDFLKIVPVAWDDTKFLDGYPGRLMVMARRKGKDWFVAAANGEPKEKNIAVDLSFLPKGKYLLQIMKDGEVNTAIKTTVINYSTRQPLAVKVPGNGGFVIWVKKI